VSQYQKKHSPTCHPDHHPIFISFFHLLLSIASSLEKSEKRISGEVYNVNKQMIYTAPKSANESGAQYSPESALGQESVGGSRNNEVSG